MKKVLKMVTSIIMAVCICIAPANAYKAIITYEDVDKNAWYYEAVNSITNDYGYMSGDSDSNWNFYFRPNDTVTRAELCTVLSRISIRPEGAYEISYTDNSSDYWYWNAIQDYSASIGGTYNTGTRNQYGMDIIYAYPNSPATREQVAAGLYNVNYVYTDSTDYTSYLSYNDSSSISPNSDDANYRKAIATFQAKGIMVGSNNNFRPKDNITRAELAQVLLNLEHSKW